MLVVSGQGHDTQWFDYVTNYFAQPTRVEWDKGTMFAVLPSDTAGFLMTRNYARLMTEAEIEEYTAPAQKSEPNVESSRAKAHKRGESS